MNPRPEQFIRPLVEGPKVYPAAITAAIIAIRKDIMPVARDGAVYFGKGDAKTLQYKFPKADDVMDQVIPLLQQHNLWVAQTEVKQTFLEATRMVAITYDFTIGNAAGEVWPLALQRTGMAWMADSRGNPDDKASNKAATQAEKWFYIKFFGIRTSDAAQMDNDAVVPGADGETAQTAQAPAAVPKPPRPGSPEAAENTGPRRIPVAGASAEDWTQTFLDAIRGQPREVIQSWIEQNATTIERIRVGNYPDLIKRIDDAVNPPAPKPPRPEAAEQAPTPPRPPAPQAKVPDPASDGPGWITWLTDKMATFTTYEDGEGFWNDRIDPLDTPMEIENEKLGVWRGFERRFE